MVFKEQDRSVLHFLMAGRTLVHSELEDILNRVFDQNEEPRDCDAVIQRINSQIEKFSQKVVILSCELTGQKTYVFTSTSEHVGMKSRFSEDQIAYFYALMDSILQADGRVNSITAVNMAPGATKGKVTINNADNILSIFVSKKLLMFDGAYYYLSPLAIADFGSFISSHYETVSCVICHKMAVFGDDCPGCSAIAHKHCLRKLFKNNSLGRCPSCKQNWQVSSDDMS